MSELSTTYVRASSWGALFDCAYKWEWEILLGHKKPSGMRAVLGTAIHASTAVFDQGKLDKSGISALDAAAVMIDKIYKPEYDVDYTVDELTPRDAENIGLVLHAKYCGEITPLMRYVEVETDLKPLPIKCGSQIVTLTGKMDRARVALHGGEYVIPDIKTGKSVMSNGKASIKGRSAQLGTYQLLYENTRNVQTGGAQVIAMATTKSPAVAVSQVFDAKRVMVGEPGKRGLIEYAADMFASGLFPPNPSSTLCAEKYCARWNHCHFHE